MIKRAFNRLWSNERGNVLIIAAAAMPMLVGSAGLATDTIQWALWKRQLQRAADSAAIAGVYERNVTPMGATTRVSAAVLRDLSLNQHAGTLTGAPALEFPPDVKVPDKRTNQVKVTISVAKALTFSSFFLKTPPVITASSTAASVPGAGEYCVIALDDRNATGMTFGGSTHVDLGDCCMITNASHPNQAFRSNGAKDISAGCIAAQGGVERSDDWDVDGYFPYSEPAADPYAHLEVPAKADCDEHVSFGNQVKSDIDRVAADAPTSAVPAKIVCINGGFDIKANLTLGAATYVINLSDAEAFGMTTPNASLTCAGCTIILTNYTDPTKTGNIDLSGGKLNISAPVTAGHPYRGVALFQDRRAADGGGEGANHVNGNSSSGVQGVLYTPGRSLKFNGSGNVGDTGGCMQIVARRVTFTGNSSLKMGSLCGGAGMVGHTGGGWLVRLVA